MEKCCVKVYLRVRGLRCSRWARSYMLALPVWLLFDARDVEEIYLVRHSRVRSLLRWEFEEVADLQHEYRRQFELVHERRGFVRR
jgi:hypothetical protein